MLEFDTDEQQLLGHFNGILPDCTVGVAYEDAADNHDARYCIFITVTNKSYAQLHFLPLEFTQDTVMELQLDILRRYAEHFSVPFMGLFSHYVYEQHIEIAYAIPRLQRLQWLLLNRPQRLFEVLPQVLHLFLHALYFLPLAVKLSSQLKEIYFLLRDLIDVLRKSDMFAKFTEQDALFFNRIEAHLYLLEINAGFILDKCGAGAEISVLSDKIRNRVSLANSKCLIGLLCNMQREIDAGTSEDLVADMYVVVETFAEVKKVYNRELMSCDFSFLTNVLVNFYRALRESRFANAPRLTRALADCFQDLPDIILGLDKKGVEVVRAARNLMPLLLTEIFYSPGDEVYDDQLVSVLQLLCQYNYVDPNLFCVAAFDYTHKFEEANLLYVLMTTISSDLIEKMLFVLRECGLLLKLISKPVHWVFEGKPMGSISFFEFLVKLLQRYPIGSTPSVTLLMQELMEDEKCHPVLIGMFNYLGARKVLTQEMVVGGKASITSFAIRYGLVEFIECFVQFVKFGDDELIDLLKDALDHRNEKIAKMLFGCLEGNLCLQGEEEQLLNVPKTFEVYLHKKCEFNWPFSKYVYAGKLMEAGELLAHPEIQKLQEFGVKVTLELYASVFKLKCFDYKHKQSVEVDLLQNPIGYRPRVKEIKAMLLQRYTGAVVQKAFVCIPIKSILDSRLADDKLISLVYQQTAAYARLKKSYDGLQALLIKVQEADVSDEIPPRYSKVLFENQEALIENISAALENLVITDAALIKLLKASFEKWQERCAKALAKSRKVMMRRKSRAQQYLDNIETSLKEIRENGGLKDEPTISEAYKLVRFISKHQGSLVAQFDQLEKINYKIASVRRRQKSKQLAVVAKALVARQRRPAESRCMRSQSELMPKSRRSPQPEIKRSNSDPATPVVALASPPPRVSKSESQLLVAPQVVQPACQLEPLQKDDKLGLQPIARPAVKAEKALSDLGLGFFRPRVDAEAFVPLQPKSPLFNDEVFQLGWAPLVVNKGEDEESDIADGENFAVVSSVVEAVLS